MALRPSDCAALAEWNVRLCGRSGRVEVVGTPDPRDCPCRCLHVEVVTESGEILRPPINVLRPLHPHARRLLALPVPSVRR
jgi:hypothetical protein